MEESDQIEVLLADDHRMMRDGLRSTINQHPDMVVIGEASNGEQAIIFVQENSPDIVVMDVDMPIMDGIEATKTIRSITPEVDIVGLSLHEIPVMKENMLKAGASAYISKDEAANTLCSTIRQEAKA